MSKIKIFVDAHIFDGTYQGTQTYLKGLYNSLVQDNDFEITLGSNNVEILKDNFPDVRFKFITLPSKSKYRRLALDIPEIIRNNKFEYAHFQYVVPFKKECKYINTIHDLLFLDFPAYFPYLYRLTKSLTFKYSASRADIICTVSEYSKESLIKHFKINEAKITITPNAIDVYPGNFVDIKRKYNIDKYILFVSRFEPRKNHYGLLKCFVDLELYKRGYKLVFIGKIDDVVTKEFNQYFKGLPNEIKSTVVCLENIVLNELNNFYSQAEVFIYPSIAEGFGIPPLEAAMNNCKVLCSNQTAMRDFDFFGKFLFEPDNLTELKKKVLDILKDQNYPYQEIREAIVEKYNWKSIAEKFGNRLKELSVVNL